MNFGSILISCYNKDIKQKGMICLNEREFKPGDIVQHFKRETLENPNSTEYLYMIVGTAIQTETGEKLVLYKPLYKVPPCLADADVAARPYSMFMSEVDKEKYPNIKQKYRFEKLIK